MRYAANTNSRTYGARQLGRLARIAGLAFALIVSAATISHAETFDIISKQLDTPTSTVWRIETPNVKQAETSYPEIRFAPGDSVSVAAGGCVQTGGHGRTWKRYVDPSGDESDKIYHGLIAIPGVTNGLVRLKNFGLNAQHVIPTNASTAQASNMYLRLGYEDENSGAYGDNGYYSHDDGTGDQCKNSVKAFVIVSIGHAGAQAQNASNFIGITPANFRCQGAWAFSNFPTAELSWSTFKNAFSMSWYDYLDPATYVTFLATRGNLAASGNCAGMSILADVAEDQFLVDDLQENLWQQYKSKDVAKPKVIYDINTAHWQQLSVSFLHSWLFNVVRDPIDSANQAESDLTKQNYNYGVISIAHGTGGHVLVPLRVSHSGGTTFIDVYDSNRPCGQVPDTAHYPQIIISGGKWSYDMGGSDGTWSGSAANDGLAYIPYNGSDGWTKLGTNFSGLVGVIFGGDTEVTQVTDGKGRQLFAARRVAGGPEPALQVGAQGLQQSVFRLPLYGQGRPARPRQAGPRYTLKNEAVIPASALPDLNKLDTEYAADYAGSGKVFLVNDANLADLRFEVTTRNAAKPVRVMIHQGNAFFEAQTRGASGSAAVSFVTLHKLADVANAGVSIASADGKPLSAIWTYGMKNDAEKSVHVFRTTAFPVTAGSRAFSTARGLSLATRDAPMQMQTAEEITTAAGTRLNAAQASMAVKEP